VHETELWPQLAIADGDEGVGESMAGKIRNAASTTGLCGTWTALRSGYMTRALQLDLPRRWRSLINPHAYAVAASHAPVL
jgi:hypothetical protein